MSDRKYRVLVLAEEMESGGGPRTIITIARALAEAGHHVALATQGGRLLQPALDAGLRHYLLPGARLWPVRGQLSLSNMWRLLWIIWREKPDVIHCFRRWSLYLATVTSFIHRRPLVFTNNTISPRLYGCRIAAAITATSPQFGRFIAESARVPVDQVTVIPNRIDLRAFTPDSLPDRQGACSRLGIPADRRIVAFISRFMRGEMGKVEGLWRFLKTLPELHRRLPDVLVALAGIGSDSEEVRSKCAEANQRLGGEVVRPLGVLPSVADLLGCADLVVGTGRCIMEAMACGLPTAIIGHAGFAGIVGPDMIAAIADTNFAGRNVSPGQLDDRMAPDLAAILTDEGLAKRLGEFGRHYVGEQLDIRRGVIRYSEVYRQAIEEPNPALDMRFRSARDMTVYLLGKRQPFRFSETNTNRAKSAADIGVPGEQPLTSEEPGKRDG